MEFVSCSHWGLFPHVVTKPQWAITAPISYDAQYLHATYQHLNFGPYLS